MLVNKPQFDGRELSPGTPVQVTAQKWDPVNGSYAWPAIVTKFTPLQITVSRFNNDMDDFESGYAGMEEVTISVDTVASGHVQIDRLKPEGK